MGSSRSNGGGLQDELWSLGILEGASVGWLLCVWLALAEAGMVGRRDGRQGWQGRNVDGDVMHCLQILGCAASMHGSLSQGSLWLYRTR